MSASISSSSQSDPSLDKTWLMDVLIDVWMLFRARLKKEAAEQCHDNKKYQFY